MSKTYNIHDYDVPLTTVDVAIFTVLYGQLHVLLVKRSTNDPADPYNGKWSLPGGFIDLKNDRDLEGAAKRKLKEKTGVNAPYLEQVGTVGDGVRDYRGWSVTIVYFALLPSHKVQLNPGKGTDEVKWVPVDDKNIKPGSLAFDHNKLLSLATERLQEKVKYTTLPIYLMPQQFTLPALQTTYEIILGKKQEAKSFRRRLLDARVIEKVPSAMTREGKGRPAELYRAAGGGPHYFIRNLSGVKD